MSDEQLLTSFIETHDESAFAAIVENHGPMVFGVCSRMLGNHHDAEEAFQATFLILSVKAKSISPRSMLGNWLYGVASKTSLKARQLRRHRPVLGLQESELTPPPHSTSSSSSTSKILSLLDEELTRLPGSYRIPIVLCDLEGFSHREAGNRLGISEDAVSMRLTRGRRILANRLLKRGCAFSAAAMAGFLAESAVATELPQTLAASTVNLATLAQAGLQTTHGLISPSLVTLTTGVLKSMSLSKLKSGILVALTLSAAGTGSLFYRMQAAEPAPTASSTISDNIDVRKLWGTWDLVAVESHGKVVPEDVVKARNLSVLLKEDSYQFSNGGGFSLRGKLVINTKTNPPQMDWTQSKSEGAVESGDVPDQFGIFRLEKDQLILSCDLKERPKEFITKDVEGRDQRLYTFKQRPPK